MYVHTHIYIPIPQLFTVPLIEPLVFPVNGVKLIASFSVHWMSCYGAHPNSALKARIWSSRVLGQLMTADGGKSHSASQPCGVPSARTRGREWPPCTRWRQVPGMWPSARWTQKPTETDYGPSGSRKVTLAKWTLGLAVYSEAPCLKCSRHAHW